MKISFYRGVLACVSYITVGRHFLSNIKVHNTTGVSVPRARRLVVLSEVCFVFFFFFFGVNDRIPMA
jgi:hypothetical protein